VNSKDVCWQMGGRRVEDGVDLYVSEALDKKRKLIS
jgi:hypothetical protein